MTRGQSSEFDKRVILNVAKDLDPIAGRIVSTVPAVPNVERISKLKKALAALWF